MALSSVVKTSNKAVKAKQKAVAAVKDPNYRIKQAIWLYFLLLIFEGALRKWILPGLATPILIIRDPVALYILITANQRNLIPKSSYVTGMIIIGGLSIFTAVALGHGNFIVAIYGARIYMLHFPLIFAIGAVFNKEDVIKMGKVILYIAIPMAVIIALQFYSPQSAWINRGVGGDEAGAGFSGANGFFRPPGTFSFTNGNTLFFSLVAPFIFFFWLKSQYINRLILISATIAMLAAIPLSISRSLFFSIIVTLIFTVFSVARKPAYAKRIFGAAIGVAVLFAVLSSTSFFKTATDAFTTRFEGANESEGGVQSVLVDRYLGGLASAITSAGNIPFFGYGIGIGSNIGAKLITDQYFVAPEGEWGKIIAEQGFILGMGVIIIRMLFSIDVLKGSYKRLSRGDLLPWILLSYFLVSVPQAQWKQPTTLGFSIIIAGLQMASLRNPKRRIRPVLTNPDPVTNLHE